MGKTENQKAPNLSSLRGPGAKPQPWKQPRFDPREELCDELRAKILSGDKYPFSVLSESVLYDEINQRLGLRIEDIGESLAGEEDKNWTLKMIDVLQGAEGVNQAAVVERFNERMLVALGRQIGGKSGDLLAGIGDDELNKNQALDLVKVLRAELGAEQADSDQAVALFIAEDYVRGGDMSAFHYAIELSSERPEMLSALAEEMILAIKEVSEHGQD